MGVLVKIIKSEAQEVAEARRTLSDEARRVIQEREARISGGKTSFSSFQRKWALSRVKSVAGTYRDEQGTPRVKANFNADSSGYILYEGSTWEEVSELVYGTEQYANLIKQSNVVRYKTVFGVKGLPEKSYIYCPAMTGPSRSTVSVPDRVPDKVEEDKTIPEPTVTPRTLRPEWITKQLAALAKEKDGLAILVFTKQNQTDEEFGDKAHKVVGLTKFRTRGSLFEGSRTMEFTVPYSIGQNPDVNLFGNHVVVGFNGNPIFCGMLITPKIDVKKSTTISWLAMSHSYVAIKSHINPVDFEFEWSDVTPLEAIRRMSAATGTPVSIAHREREMLKETYADEDGLRNIATDIQGTTPFKFMSKYVNNIGRFLTADVDGFLRVDHVQTNTTPEIFLTDGKEDVSATSVLGLFTVRYNFDELARTYSVASQRREHSDLQLINIPEFPLPIFKNAVRTELNDVFLEEISDFKGIDDLPEDRRVEGTDAKALDASAVAKVQELKGAARAKGSVIFEASKAFAKAVKITVEVPTWVNPVTARPWRENFPVGVRSEIHGIPYTFGVISGVELQHVKGRRSAKLSISLTGLFNAILPWNIPFLKRNNEPMNFTTQNYQELVKGEEDTE